MASRTFTLTRDATLDIVDGFARDTSADLYKTNYINAVSTLSSNAIDIVIEKEGYETQYHNWSMSPSGGIVSQTISLLQSYMVSANFVHGNTSDSENGNFIIKFAGDTIYSGKDVVCQPNTTNSVKVNLVDFLSSDWAYSYMFDENVNFDFNVPTSGTLTKDFSFTAHYGNCCVPYYAQISTTDGNIQAAEVVVGTSILAYNEQTQSVEYAKVTSIQTPKRSALARYHLSNGEFFEVTLNHTLYTDHGWAAYDISHITEVPNFVKVEVGFKVFDQNAKWVEIVDIELLEFPDYIQCYDFTTSLGTFYADGYLVHNAPCPGDETPGDIVLNILDSNVYTVHTPFGSINIPEGATVSEYMQDIYKPNSNIAVTQSITKITGYTKDGQPYDLSTPVTEDFSIEPIVELNVPTSNQITVICGESTDTNATGVWGTITIRGYSKYDEVGSCTKLFDAFDFYEATAGFYSNSEYFDDQYKFCLRVSSGTVQSLFGDVKITMKTDTGIILYDNKTFKPKEDILRNTWSGIDITQGQYNAFTGTRKININVELA